MHTLNLVLIGRNLEMWRPAARLAVMSLLGLIPHAATSGEARADASFLRQLRTDATAAWRGMAEQASRSRFEYDLTETQHHAGTTLQRTKRVSARLSGECFLIEERIVATDQLSVYGRNGQYEFALARSGESPWSVSWQSGLSDPQTPVGSARAYLVGLLELPWSISAVPLERLVADRRFLVRSARALDEGLVEVDFDVAPLGSGADELQRLEGGTLVLDPKRQWAVARYRARYANAMWSAVELLYGSSGPPELRRVRFELHTAPERSSGFRIEVARYERQPSDCEQFTLAAFGLPEYHPPGGGRRWLALVNIGIIFVLVGLILWRRRREV